MILFDTHCHIADSAFDADSADVIDRFLNVGGRKAVVVADPCEEIPNQEKVFSLVEAHDFLYAAIGVHPHNSCRYSAEVEKEMLEYLGREKCKLFGEIGLDYHYDLSPRDIQREVFSRQLDLAYDLNKPVQLHIREAHGDCMDMLRARTKAGRMPKGIMHCFTGSWESAKVYLDCGLYISLSGAVTFKNAPKLAEVCEKMPADRLLSETDCPYMAPVPMRGKRNEPSFIAYTVTKIAQLRNESPDETAQMLYQNACRALGIDA